MIEAAFRMLTDIEEIPSLHQNQYRFFQNIMNKYQLTTVFVYARKKHHRDFFLPLFTKKRERGVSTSREIQVEIKPSSQLRAVCKLIWSFSAPVGRYLAGIVSPNHFLTRSGIRSTWFPKNNLALHDHILCTSTRAVSGSTVPKGYHRSAQTSSITLDRTFLFFVHGRDIHFVSGNLARTREGEVGLARRVKQSFSIFFIL